MVGSEEEYARALKNEDWDVVLSDHNLPEFDSLYAPRKLQEHGKDVPFIVVSGAIGEETAVAAMKAGASDYVMKHNLARLAPAIEREIREAAVRREKRRVEEERERAVERMAASLREKDVLLREVQHRVKNNLQVIASLLSLHASRAEHPAAAQALLESHNRVRAMALVHEKLYAYGDLARLDFRQYLQDLMPELVRGYDLEPGRVAVRIEAPEMRLDVNMAIPLALIANELVTNSLKHAFPEGRLGDITVRACTAAPGSGQALLVVADDGVGMKRVPEGG